jgi:hypothetical protein
MSKPFQRPIRKPSWIEGEAGKPTHPAIPQTNAESLSRLDGDLERTPIRNLNRFQISAISSVRDTIDKAADLFRTFEPALANLRAAVKWMYVMEEQSDGIGFDELCQNLGRDPEEVRKKLADRLPKTLERLVFHGLNYQCPFCGTKK